MSERLKKAVDMLRTTPEDCLGHVADTDDRAGWWIRDELIDNLCKEIERITELEGEVERLRKLCDNLTDSLNGWARAAQADAKKETPGEG